jgi:L,D-transpeptidase ErfK/SrfK
MFRKTILLLALLNPMWAMAARYTMPSAGNDIIGDITAVSAQSGETLNDIGDRYGLGLHEMIEANPTLSQSELGGGEQVILPTQYVLPKYRKGIVINVAECRLYYFTPDHRYVLTYPVGLGRKGWRTPTTSTTIVRKSTNPTWTVPATIRAYVLQLTGNKLPHAIPPGPENPLGPCAMYLGTHGYLIHGTNQPWTIGKLNSAGCIRLLNEDVSELYSLASSGTPVKIIHQPYKAGWLNGQLYLEAHVPVALSEQPGDLNMVSVERSILATAKTGEVNWDSIREIVSSQNGMPEPVK